MLKDTNASGHTAIDFHFRYDARNRSFSPNSALRITFAAVASKYGGQIGFIAAIRVKYLEGDMTVKVKPAPSNRIWYGFTSEPQIEFDVSVVVTRLSKITFEHNFIIDIVKAQIKKGVSRADLCFSSMIL